MLRDSGLHGDGVVHDLMHCVDLGCAAYTAGEIFSLIIKADLLELNVRNLKVRTLEAARELANRHSQWCRNTGETEGLGDLTPGMLLGSRGHLRPKLSTKAMESRVLFRYALFELERLAPPTRRAKHRRKLAYLLPAARALDGWYRVILDSPRLVSGPVARGLLHLAKNFCAKLKRAKVCMFPKAHALLDMTRKIRSLGNPRYHSVYPDETFNAVCAAIARKVHPRTFAVSLFRRLRLLKWIDGLPF